MSSMKKDYPVTWMNLEKLNKRIPQKVERKQVDFAKKFRKPKSDPLKSLAELYAFFDEIASYANGLTACKNGCSHCCHMEVGAYQIEADYIAAGTGFSVAKAAEGFARSKGGWIDTNRPCPFLKDDACSIYEFRPMVCRTHMSFEASNELCRPDNPDKERKVPQINRETSFPGAMKAYAELVERYGGNGADIRDFFGHGKPLLAMPSALALSRPGDQD